ncbi:hypothetical protein [Macrococcus epidermidis]|uniref:hypothetical protein n=1 Tax=Macrococcus epidermidis TaxID=1902580 RepID=UPI0020B7032B|nr:hypothetical protein [Macrococcus epidermidis]UTH16250.1 hypothetical protein KFV12_00260 [Macrococcus epidermidis]
MKYKIFCIMVLIPFLIMSISGCGHAMIKDEPKILVNDLLDMERGLFKKYSLAPGYTISDLERNIEKNGLKIKVKKDLKKQSTFIVGKDHSLKVMTDTDSIKVNNDNLIITDIEIVPKQKQWTEKSLEQTLSNPLGITVKNNEKIAYYSKFLTITYTKMKKQWIAEKISYHKPQKIIIYSRVDYGIDVNNPREVVKHADYVFAATVMGKNKTRYENESMNFDGSKFAEAYSSYDIAILSNIKGKLPLNKRMTIEKMGGIRKDHSAYDIPEGDIIPKKNKSYIFIAYRQPDDKLLVSGANSTIALEEKYNGRILKNLNQSKIYTKYKKLINVENS